MFKGKVSKRSHDDGLLVEFTGSCPALGTVMVDNRGRYVGKVQGVIGSPEDALVHVHNLDHKRDSNEMIGEAVSIRARSKSDNERHSNRDDRPSRDDRPQRENRPQREDRPTREDRPRREDRGGREQRGERRGGDNRQTRGDRGGWQDRSRNNDSRGRDNRGNQHGDNDWDCAKCKNSNFAFRTECNRCGEPKGEGRGRGRSDDRRDYSRGRESSGRDNRGNQHGDNDWDCAKCKNSNFAFRTECNRCGEPKGEGRGRGRSDNRRDYSSGRESRGRNSGNQHGDNDWDCPKCKNSNFSFRTECNRCGESKGQGRSDSNSRGQSDSRGRESRPRRDARPVTRNQRDSRPSRIDQLKADHWRCGCGSKNFRNNDRCFKCGSGKGDPSKNRQQTERTPRELRPERSERRPASRDAGERRPRADRPQRPERSGRRPAGRDAGERRPRYDRTQRPERSPRGDSRSRRDRGGRSR